MNFATLFSKPSIQIPKAVIIFLILISFFGFLDSTYLTIQRLTGGEPGCLLVEGCSQVERSEYSVIFNVPLSAVGIGYYLGILVSLVAFLDFKKTVFFAAVLGLSVLGFLSAMYLLYLQAFVIKAFCFYCLLSIGFSTLIFIVSLTLFLKLILSRRFL